MAGGAEEIPEGYRLALHTQVSAPITIAGIPRNYAIFVGTVVLVLSMPLRMPYIGIPVGAALWPLVYTLTKDDPHLFEVAKRHIYHSKHLEG